MELAAVDIERYGLGYFGDSRLQKRGPGVTVRLLPPPALVSWPWLKARGVGKLVLDGFYATRL
jgi:hypothetical protein